MAPPKKNTSPASKWLLAARTALGLAFLLTCYLTYGSLTGDAVAGCEGEGGCQTVLNSKWSHFLGIPVALLGALVYIVLLVTDGAERWPGLRLFLGLTVAGAALWFVLVQAVLLKAFCPWCTATHALAVLGVVSLAIAGRMGVRHAKSLRWAAPCAIAGLALFSLGQFWGKDQTAESVTKSVAGGMSVTPAPDVSKPRTINLHDGFFSFQSDSVPTMGDAGRAEHLAVGLFDYTCPHCRHLHKILEPIVEKFSPDLAVAKLPAAYRDNARDIHRAMLALWHGDPKTYDEISEEIYSGKIRAKEADVKTAIIARIGESRFKDLETAYGQIADKLIVETGKVLAENTKRSRLSKLPQLMFGDKIEVGQNSNPGHYYTLLEKNFGLRRTSIGRLIAKTPMNDLGIVYGGSRHSVSLTVRNEGDVVANISKIDLPRGASWLKPAPNKIAPDTETQFDLSILIPAIQGPIDTNLRIHSDAKPARLDLKLHATARHAFQINPKIIDFGRITSGTGVPGVARVDLEPGATLGNPVPHKSGFTAEITEARGEKTAYFVHISPPKKGIGFKTGRLEIPIVPPKDTKDVWPAKVSIPVRVILASPAKK